MRHPASLKQLGVGFLIVVISGLYFMQLSIGADMEVRIVKDPDPILRAVSEEMTADDTEALEALDDASDYLDDSLTPKSGLALPQLGISKRGFVVMLHSDPVVMINPVLSPDGELKRSFEGCLSIPGTYGFVLRYAEVQVDYLDEDWEQQSITLTGQDAFVVQHENDHLDGILFTDKLLLEEDPPQRLD